MNTMKSKLEFIEKQKMKWLWDRGKSVTSRVVKVQTKVPS